jgi:hypothetical protein
VISFGRFTEQLQDTEVVLERESFPSGGRFEI